MHDRILEIILNNLTEINEDLERKVPTDKGPDAPLFGAASALDSIGLVSLVTAVEQDVEDEYDVLITIADERAVSRKKSPFATVGMLAEYVAELVKEQR